MIRLYIIAAALAAAFMSGGYAHYRWAEAAILKAHIAAEAQARQQERDDGNRTIRALDNNTIAQARITTAAVADRSVVDSVQHSLASLPAACPADPASSANDRERTVRELLGTCTALAAEGANLVDELRARAQALEALK